MYCLVALQLPVFAHATEQVHVKFQVFVVTKLAVHTLHKFALGAVVVAVQFAVQHTQS